MGRTARRPGPPTFLFGVWGDGETTPENIDALLSEHIEGLGEITPRFVIPCDKEITTDTHLAVFEFAQNNEYAVEVVQAAPPRVKALREMKDYADKIHEADDGDNPIEKVFAETLAAKAPDNAQLLFLWAEDADGEPIEEDQRVLFDCLDGGVVALDLTQGLDALGAEDDGAEGSDDGDDTADEPEPEAKGTEDEPSEETVRDWPIRRIRTYAKEVAETRDDAPTDDELDDMGKNELLGFLYGDAEPEPEEEPKKTPAKKTARTPRKTAAAKEEPADDGEEKGFTRERARQVREETEDKPARSRRRAAEPVAEEPEEAPEGDATEETAVEPFQRLRGAIETLLDGEATDSDIGDAVEIAAEALADVIINRIAARVEREPEDSKVRQEIAPKRPPGKPRKDGATPTRRRTRA